MGKKIDNMICNAYEDLELKYAREQNDCFIAVVKTDRLPGDTLQRIRVLSDLITIETIRSKNIENNLLQEASKRVIHTNKKLPIGHFDIDPSDGEILFRSSVFRTKNLSKKVMRQHITLGFSMMEIFEDVMDDQSYYGDIMCETVKWVHDCMYS